MRITNTKMDKLLVDAVDFDLNMYRWCARPGGYAVTPFYFDGGRVDIKLHRAIVTRKVRRELQPGEVVDHINGKPWDNRRANLRVVTAQQNCWNRRSRRGSRSKYIGVWLSSRSGRWAAFVKRDGIRFHIGYSDTDMEAAWMRDQWASVIQGEYARLNFHYVEVPRQDGHGYPQL